MANKLPNWIKQDKVKPNTFHLDPDKFYPGFLKELEALDPVVFQGETFDFKGKIDRNWLEIAMQCFKLDAIKAKREAGLDPWGCMNIIRGSKGYKGRWALTSHPEGKLKTTPKGNDFSGPDARFLALTAKEIYKKLRGFIPE